MINVLPQISLFYTKDVTNVTDIADITGITNIAGTTGITGITGIAGITGITGIPKNLDCVILGIQTSYLQQAFTSHKG